MNRRQIPFRRRAAILSASAILVLASTMKAGDMPRAELSRLFEGQLVHAELTLRSHLAQNSEDDNARFGLGMTQCCRAVERTTRALYRYGLGNRNEIAERYGTMLRGVPGAELPVLRLPVGVNPEPERVDYSRFRAVLARLLEDLEEAERTLAAISRADVKLNLDLSRLPIDADGDGKIAADETLPRILERIAALPMSDAAGPRSWQVSLDRGDVHWLRGYCHVLMTMLDVVLAHDFKEFFDYISPILFPKVDTRNASLSFTGDQFATGIADLIGAIHLLRFDVVEPDRMRSAHAHAKAVIEQSRESWKWILRETDDDREWLPNPKQTSVIVPVRVTQAWIDAWHDVLNEADDILAGKTLIPHWRLREPNEGVNLRRFFLEPRRLDPILWIQGSAAVPYIEKGPTTSLDKWRRINETFQGSFLFMAAWFN